MSKPASLPSAGVLMAIKAEGARPVESVGGRRANVIGTAMPFRGMLERVT